MTNLCLIKDYLKDSIFIYPFTLSIITSLIAASIFYYFFNFLPRLKQKKSIEIHAIYLIEKIIINILHLIQTCTKKQLDQRKLKYRTLELEDINEALKSKNYDDTISRINKFGSLYTIGEASIEHLNNINKNCDALLRYIIHLELSIIEILNEVQRNTINERFLNHNHLKKFLELNPENAPNTDLTIYDESLYEYYQIILKLKDWLYINYPKNIKVILLKYNEIEKTSNSFELELNLSKKLSKSKEHLKFYSIARLKALIGLKKIRKARHFKKKIIKNGILTPEEVKKEVLKDTRISNELFEEIK